MTKDRRLGRGLAALLGTPIEESNSQDNASIASPKDTNANSSPANASTATARGVDPIARNQTIRALTDEAHHAYRPKPAEKSARKKKDDTDVGEATTEDVLEATVWVGGLDKFHQAVGIQSVVDLSATPFYLQGTGHIPGSPCPWLVSDF